MNVATRPDRRADRATPSILSVVVPVFDEEEAIDGFLATVRPILERSGMGWEIVFVNDGSSDGTLTALLAACRADRRLRAIDLSRNFGKEAAMTAGLDHSRGDAVVVMDVDLQDPPELLLEMIARWREGWQVVYGQRARRGADGPFKRLTARGFYGFFNWISESAIPPDVGDFRLMDRQVVDALARLPERVRFMKGLFAWVGFRAIAVEYDRPERHAGSTKFDYWRLWNFALDGITSFSTVPLRMWTYFGLVVAMVSFLYGAFIVGRTLLLGTDVPGYSSLVTIMLFFGGVQLIGLGIIGEYVGRVYSEVKRRPLYLVAGLHGFAVDEARDAAR